MKLPLAWLRDYLDVELSSDDVAARLAGLGFPVEGIERRPHLSGIVAGKLVRVEKHPAADRLQVCTVDVGRGEALTIATAATNVATGNVVPVATIGAHVVGMQIAPRTMRGIASQGMLCSAGELGLEESSFEDGILQLEELAAGTDVVATFGLDADVLDVEMLANRVDAMSVLGLARELGAALGTTVREPATHVERYAGNEAADARIEIESVDCKRFVAQRFSGVSVGRSPFWMRVRLALAGQRPIDSLVDVSNFVMLETAQPLHFYDFERLAGGRLTARDARDGERIRTLDEADRALDPRFLVIADDREPQGIAGLKGGAGSEVTAATRELLLEAASFSGPRIRRMSVALGLRTEASARHEKGLPLGLSTFGAARAAHLLERQGARVHRPFFAGAADAPAPPIRVALARFPALLGIDVAPGEAESALGALGFETRPVAGEPAEALDVTAPPWRGDVRIPEDVVEEVARVVGYDRIPERMPPVAAQTVSSRAYRDERRVAHALAALGYRETMSLALQPHGVAAAYERAGVSLPAPLLEIHNPLSEDQRYLRFSLLPGLLSLAAKRAGGDAFRAFEIGHAFAGGAEPSETAEALWISALPPSPDEPRWRDSGFLEFKSDALALVRTLTGRAPETVTSTRPGLHPGKTAALLVDGKAVAAFGAVDPRLAAAFGVDGRAYAALLRFTDLPAYRVRRYEPPSAYPPVARDLALVVGPEIPALDIERAVRAGGDGAIAEVRVFDEYRGAQIPDGKKSLAVRVVLQRRDATLTDAEADRHVAAILQSLAERCGATIRA